MKNFNKPHAEDHVEAKEAKELKTKTPEHGVSKGDRGGFEDAHVVMDGEASGIKKSFEKQKKGLVGSQDLSQGVGEPGESGGKLPHHLAHNKATYMAEEAAEGE